MALSGEYEPSPEQWVRDQVEAYEASGGQRANTLRDTGLPVVIVASKGGAPEHPVWFHNLVAHPEIELQDGPEPRPMTTRLIDGEERAAWWDRAVAAYPPYAEYQTRTDREIPVFLAEPAGT